MAAHHHLDLRLGQGQLGQVGLHLGRQQGRRVPAGGRHLRRGLGFGGACGGEAGVELGRSVVVVLELTQPDPEPVTLGQDVGQRLAVLAPQIVQELPALAQLGEAFRVLVDRLTGGPQLARHVAQLGCQRPQPRLGIAKGRSPRQERQRRADGIGGRCGGLGRAFGAVAAEQHDRTGRRLAVRGGIGQLVLQPLQLRVLVRTGDGGGVDVGNLVAQEVQLAGPRPLVAAHLAELGEYGADLLPGGLQRSEVDLAEPVERFALRGRVQQGLVGVLAVEIDQLGAHLLRARRPSPAARRCRPDSAPIGGWPAPARSRRPPRRRRRGRGRRRPRSARRAGRIGPRPMPRRLRTAPAPGRRVPDQELDGVDDEGLAGPGLAGERRHPRAEEQAQLGDDPEIADGQFEDHPVT